MPKLRVDKDIELNRLIVGTIKKYMTIREVNAHYLASKANISIRTMQRRLHDKKGVELFNISELRNIVRALSIPANEIANPIIGLYQ